MACVDYRQDPSFSRPRKLQSSASEKL